MTTLRRPVRAVDRAPAGTAAAILAALAAASLVELLVLRTFTRTAIHIPAAPALQQPYEALSFAGRYAYFVSVALLITGLPLAAAFLWGTRSPVGRTAAIAAAAFVLVAAVAAAGLASRPLLDAATLASILLLALSAAFARGPAEGASLALFGVAFVAAGLHTSLQSAGQQGLIDAKGDTLLLGAELAGAGFALASPLFVARRLTRGTLILGAGAALVAFAFFQGGGSTARILLLWNGGLQGALPAAVYALAAGALAAAALRLYQARDLTTLAGLVLLLAGGVGLHNTYQTGLVVAGFMALQLAPSARVGPRDIALRCARIAGRVTFCPPLR